MSRRARTVVLLFVLALAVGGFLVWERTVRVPDLSRWDDLIERNAQAFSIEADLLRGIMAAESGGRPEVVSSAGAVGLCQLMPPTAQEQADLLGVSDYSRERLTEPALNVRLGAAYLARMLRAFDGDEVFAVAAYNAGPGRTRKWQRRLPDVPAREVIEREGYAETRTYVKRVFRFREAYRERRR